MTRDSPGSGDRCLDVAGGVLEALDDSADAIIACCGICPACGGERRREVGEKRRHLAARRLRGCDQGKRERRVHERGSDDAREAEADQWGDEWFERVREQHADGDRHEQRCAFTQHEDRRGRAQDDGRQAARIDVY